MAQVKVAVGLGLGTITTRLGLGSAGFGLKSVTYIEIHKLSMLCELPHKLNLKQVNVNFWFHTGHKPKVSCLKDLCLTNSSTLSSSSRSGDRLHALA